MPGRSVPDAVSEPLAHLYDLALRTLDEQERRAEALRGRLGPLAAAALGVTLLSGPLVAERRTATSRRQARVRHGRQRLSASAPSRRVSHPRNACIAAFAAIDARDLVG